MRTIIVVLLMVLLPILTFAQIPINTKADVLRVDKIKTYKLNYISILDTTQFVETIHFGALTDSMDFWKRDGVYAHFSWKKDGINKADIYFADKLLQLGTKNYFIKFDETAGNNDNITVRGNTYFYDTLILPYTPTTTGETSYLVLQDDTLKKQSLTITETDPIWANDSANVLHWADTITTITTANDIADMVEFSDTTSVIATKYDIDTLETVDMWGVTDTLFANTFTPYSGTTQTFTGNVSARVVPRVGYVASSATPTIDIGLFDAYSITALATAITSMTRNLSGTPTNFQKLIIRIKDDGTARAIAWGASFSDGIVALPTTTIISKTLTVGLIYNTVTSKWECMASGSQL